MRIGWKNRRGPLLRVDDVTLVVITSVIGGTSRMAARNIWRSEPRVSIATVQLPSGERSTGSVYSGFAVSRRTVPVVRSAANTSMLDDSSGYPM